MGMVKGEIAKLRGGTAKSAGLWVNSNLDGPLLTHFCRRAITEVTDLSYGEKAFEGRHCA